MKFLYFNAFIVIELFYFDNVLPDVNAVPSYRLTVVGNVYVNSDANNRHVRDTASARLQRVAIRYS